MTAEAATPSYPRHNWLPAVIPADARRFRVEDEKLAATLAQSGGAIVDTDPDVEIAPASEIRGDAGSAIVSLGFMLPEGGSRLGNAWRRSAGSMRVRALAAKALRAVRERGYPSVTTVLWEWEQVLRLPGATNRHHSLGLAARFPLDALVVGSRRRAPTALDAALTAAGSKERVPISAGWPLVSQGGLVVLADSGVVRVSIGPARQELERLWDVLPTLRSAEPPRIVADRVPWLLEKGESGLVEWSVEGRLPGTAVGPKLTSALLGECLEFLVALHSVARGGSQDAPLVAGAELIVRACGPHVAPTLIPLARRLDEQLEDVPRGFAHGDFWTRNLLSEGGRLTGVVDWVGGGPGRLPLLDLFHLRLSAQRERTRQYLGPAVVEQLLPWARSGGDDLVRAHCRRLGLAADGERLEAFALTYWLTRVAHEIEMYADRPERPVWMYHNVELVLRALSEDVRKPRLRVP